MVLADCRHDPRRIDRRRRYAIDALRLIDGRMGSHHGRHTAYVGGAMATRIRTVPAISGIPEAASGHDAARLQIHFLLGVSAPSARTHDWYRLSRTVRVLSREALDEPAARDALRSSLCARRHAGRHGLADGGERTGRSTEREPLPPRRPLEPRVPDFRIRRLARPRYARNWHRARAGTRHR